MQQITVTELKAKMDQEVDFLLLDVREPEEYEAYNLKGLLLPLAGVLAGNLDPIEEWKDREVVVHCRSGARSMNACMVLEAQGFRNVKNLVGGVLAWAAAYDQ